LSSVTSEAIILIAVVVAAVALSVNFLSAMSMIEEKTTITSNAMGDKISTSVKIIYASGVNSTLAKIWIKNIGTSTIYDPYIQDSDLFFGPQGNFEWYKCTTSETGWTYQILGEGNGWRPGQTLEITIKTSTTISPSEYYVKFVTYNGISSDLYFTIGD
jgi:archaeal flagellar protein FlaG